MVPNNLEKVAVFCASRMGKDPFFESAAESLGKHIASNQFTLVYGSSVDGLMGKIALSALNNGGKVIGINAKVFDYCLQPEHKNFEYLCFETIEQRQRALIDNADAYVVFTGGFGTLFEYYHVINLISIGLIPVRPVVIVNLNHSFDNLIGINNSLINNNLASRPDFEQIVESIDEVIPALKKGFEKCLNYRK